MGSSTAVSEGRQNPPLQQRSSQTNPSCSKHEQQATGSAMCQASPLWQDLLPTLQLSLAPLPCPSAPVGKACSKRPTKAVSLHREVITGVPSKPRCLYTLPPAQCHVPTDASPLAGMQRWADMHACMLPAPTCVAGAGSCTHTAPQGTRCSAAEPGGHGHRHTTGQTLPFAG